MDLGKTEGNKVVIMLVVKDTQEVYATLVNDNEWSPQCGNPFFATTVRRSFIFEEALGQANFRMLAMWAKDEFKLEHKKITIKLCPTLNKLAGSRRQRC